MHLTTYRDADGAIQMMNDDTVLEVMRDLGHGFAVALAELGHDTKESDLMNGLAAYHMLKLEGESARVDAAHKRVIKIITDVAFDMARGMAR